ncbi:MAG: hypothetical protein GX335_03545 [Firmicutes bacterium]|nr:hypothetical protein [Bacillota bacterium]
MTYWLNLWPPSFAPLLGQDYEALGRLCHGAKHFPYHKLGGGADLGALIFALAGDGFEEQVFQELARSLKLGSLSFAQYLKTGLPLSFVSDQTRWGKNAFKRNKIFAGIQIWDIPHEEIGAASEAAWAGGADGLFFYCYGWATLAALGQVGEYVRALQQK